jgi:hypothetical protein
MRTVLLSLLLLSVVSLRAQSKPSMKHEIDLFCYDLEEGNRYANAKFAAGGICIRVGYITGGLLPLKYPGQHFDKLTETFIIGIGIGFNLWGGIEKRKLYNPNKVIKKPLFERL